MSKFSFICFLLAGSMITLGILLEKPWLWYLIMLALIMIFVGVSNDAQQMGKAAHNARHKKNAEEFAKKYPHYINQARETACKTFKEPQSFLPEKKQVPNWLATTAHANQSIELLGKFFR